MAAVVCKNSSTITISGGTISECEALTDNGGGLYADNSTINISDGTISGCKGVWGGGLYAENSSTIEISGGTISGCTVGAGGGLFVDGSTLTIKGGTISKCITSDTGNGGGLYAYNSIITISGGTIKDNKAAYGGGVALIDSTIQEIKNWKVIGNEAYETGGIGGIGGGIKLENGSMKVSDGSNQIYNNKADRHGADVFLYNGNASIKLPNAANMNATYRDSGIEIDGWYNDNPPYTPSENGVGVDVSGELTGELSLVASYKTILVRIEIDANGGVGGSGSQTVQKGTTVTLEAPTKEGHLFTGWKDEKGNSYPAGADGKVNITVNEDMKLTAVWEARTFTVTYVLLDGKTRTETAAYGQTVTLVEEPRIGYTFVGWKDGEKMY
ncbi:MAG: InlB B-repeat-containing protein, partial [Christensenellales bacterium]